MPHDGYLGLQDSLDYWQAFAPTFQLDAISAALADQTPGIAHGFFNRDMVAEPGHVGYYERVGLCPRHCRHVMNHDIDGGRQRIFIAQYDVRQRIANQDNIRSRPVSNTRRRGVVGRHHF